MNMGSLLTSRPSAQGMGVVRHTLIGFLGCFGYLCAQASPPPFRPPLPNLITNTAVLPLPGRGSTNLPPIRSLRDTNSVVLDSNAAATMIQSIRLDPRGTNQMDFVSMALSNSIENYEGELANSNLDPALRQAFKQLLDERKRQLADHQTNAQLWANVHQAAQSKNPGELARAKQELADYLAARIRKPKGASLDAVIGEYQKKTGDRHWFDNETLIRSLLLIVLVCPLLLIVFLSFRKRRVGSKL